MRNVLYSGNSERAMQRERVIALLKEYEREIRDLGVTRLSLFGSMARGEAREDSDIDVLVDIEPERKFSLVDHSGVRLYLCDLFGRATDVVETGSASLGVRVWEEG